MDFSIKFKKKKVYGQLTTSAACTYVTGYHHGSKLTCNKKKITHLNNDFQ